MVFKKRTGYSHTSGSSTVRGYRMDVVVWLKVIKISSISGVWGVQSQVFALLALDNKTQANNANLYSNFAPGFSKLIFQ